MHKKLTIIAITAILLTSYAAVAVSPAVYESDAASNDYSYIGFGGELTAEKAILFLLQEEADDIFGDRTGDILEDLIENDNDITIEKVKDFLSVKYDINEFNIGGSVELWFNAKYNTTDMDMAFAFSGAISIDITLTDKSAGTKIIFDDVTLTCIGNGNIVYALGGEVNDSFYVNASGGIILDGKTNVPFDDDAPLKSEAEQFNYNIGFASDLTVSFPGSNAFGIAKEKGKCEADVTVNGSYGLTSNIPEIPTIVSYVASAKKVNINYDEEEGYEVMIGKIGFDLPLTATDKEELEDEIEDMQEDVPPSLIHNNSIKINESKYNEISSKILSLKSKTDSNLSKLDIKVTYLDVNGNKIAEKTAKFGTAIESIAYEGDVPEGKKFIGWSPDNAVAIKNSYIALGDIKMMPVFATVSEIGNVDEVLASNDIIIVSIDVGETAEIPLGKFEYGKTIIIEIRNGTEIVSKWTISGNKEAGTIDSLKLGVSMESAPDATSNVANGKKSIYLNFEANGKMPSDSSISYNVSNTYNDGTAVEIYHVEGEKVTKVAQRTVNNGFIDIPTTGFSGYLIQELESYSDSGSTIDIKTIAIAAVAIVVVAGVALMVIRRH